MNTNNKDDIKTNIHEPIKSTIKEIGKTLVRVNQDRREIRRRIRLSSFIK